LSESLFEPLGERLVPTDLARGPWDHHALHGGPTSAAVVRAAEQHLAGEGAWQVSRVTLELLRPVPAEPLLFSARTTRPGRKVTLVEVSVTAGEGDGREVARAVVVGIRRSELELPASVRAPRPPDDSPEGISPGAQPRGAGQWVAFHNTAVEMRFVSGGFDRLGPCAVWMRLLVPVVAGEEVSPAMRASALADFGNGVSSELEFGAWRFLNPELTVHLARPPDGEWIRIDARTILGPSGAGVAATELSDRSGPFGRGAQSLLVEPI